MCSSFHCGVLLRQKNIVVLSVFKSNLMKNFEIFKTIKLIFQTAAEDPNIGYLELVTWAIENELTSDYKRFFTSYRISNFEELYEALVKKEL